MRIVFHSYYTTPLPLLHHIFCIFLWKKTLWWCYYLENKCNTLIKFQRNTARYQSIMALP